MSAGERRPRARPFGRWSILCGVAIAIALVVAGVLVVGFFASREPQSPPVPAAGAPGVVTLASNACCCGLTDVEVWLQDGTGERELIRADALWQNDVIEAALPEGIEGPVQVRVSFNFLYAVEDSASFVLRIEDAELMRQQGVLLLFDEGYAMGLAAHVGSHKEEVFRFGV